MNRKYYVIRTDPDSLKWHWEELQAGRLHQGWGAEGLQLTEKGVEVSESQWIQKFVEVAKRTWAVDVTEDEARARHRLLKPMLYAKLGDIIAIPKMPSSDSFSLVTVDEKGYEFDNSPVSERDIGDDFRHTIHVKELKQFNYFASIQTRSVVKYWRAYQKAVNNIRNAYLTNILDELNATSGNDKSKSIIDLFQDIKEDSLKSTLSGINRLKWSDIEDLVRILFEKQGYEVLETHKFDKKGGDADLLLALKLPLIGEALDLSLNVYVQVKQKQDDDETDEQHVQQVDQIANSDPNCVKIVISTADSFSEKAKQLASLKNVQLINGRMLSRMLIEKL